MLIETQTVKPAVFVGLASWDMIALLPGFPAPDGRLVAECIVEAGGGPAATAAVACARLGVPACFIGAVGDDVYGDRILAALRAETVDVSGVVRVLNTASCAALVLADRTQATRALCPTLPPDFTLTAGSLQARMITQAALIHADQIGYGKLAALGAALPPLSIDAGNPIPDLDHRAARLFVPTIARLEAMFGPADPATLLRRAAGADWVVATAGAAGAYALDRTRERLWHVPAFLPAPCLSTLGAGDVFHGALVAGWMRGMGCAEATAYAGITAALSCRGIDGRSAIPDHDTVMRALPAQRALTNDITELSHAAD
ncbi:carbohydrate kinase family protein [Acidocella sp. MX-AZ02]|uniref:carbohydrate kinase family protein n=2 Tax=unclassified Acidocella TaxID=2648610 RepID=UPI00028E2B80|nr:PfkB family carbohydrate kinase [Acidocella sp. MX-AZ02]EKM99880.1 sugar kinase [Acidocella sp. MX-AZ02]